MTDDDDQPLSTAVDQALTLLDQIEILLAEVRELAHRMKEPTDE